MIKVQNRKLINRLSARSLKANRLRNVFAITAIALTALLFSILFTLGIGTIDGLQQAMMRQAGGDGHAALKYITLKEFNKIKEHPLIKEISYNQMLSDDIENTELEKRHSEFWYMDDTGLRLGFCEPTHGRKPIKANEIITDTTTLKLLGIVPKIGATVPLELKIRGKVIHREFLLSGWWESDPVFNAGMIIASKAYVDAHEEELSNTYYKDGSLTGTVNAYIMFANSFQLQEKLAAVILGSGYSMMEEDANYIESNVNWSYLSSNFGSDPVSMTALLSSLLLVGLTGYLIIFNIFQISVIQDIRFFGLLKTIGTTGKQLRRIIRLEALYLSVVGIPIGLILGFFTGRSLVPMIINLSDYAESPVKIEANPWIFFGAALFSFLTVLISTNKPQRMAASVSPIEALHFTEGMQKHTTGVKRTTSGAKMYRMALSNLGRSKKRTILVVLSLSLSLVLFHTVYTLSESIDMDKYLSNFVDTDFLIANNDLFQNKYYGQENSLSEALISAVEKQPGFQEGGRFFSQRDVGFAVEDPLAVEQIYINEQGDRYAAVFGLENVPLKRLKLYDGTMDYDKLKSGKYILEGIHLDDYHQPIIDSMHFKIGDKIKLHYYTDPMEEGKKGTYVEREFIILGHVEINIYTNADQFWNYYSFYLPSEIYKQMVKQPSLMSYTYNMEDSQEISMENFLKSYTSLEEPGMNYTSKFTYKSEFVHFRNLIILIGGILSIMIGLIGILNFINAVLTSIVTRKKEFAMLQSIGMERRQLSAMLRYEGMYYVFFTGVLSLGLGALFSLLIVRNICGLLWFMSFRFIIWPILVVIPLLFLLGILIPTVAYHSANRLSIVERLREAE